MRPLLIALSLWLCLTSCREGSRPALEENQELALQDMAPAPERPLPRMGKQLEMSASQEAMAPPMDYAAGADGAGMGSEPGQPNPVQPSLAPHTSAARMLDRDGYLSIQVREYQPALDSVRAAVKRMGGFIEQVNENNADSMRIRMAEVLMRIPSARFDEAMRRLAGLGFYINSRNETVQDLTRAYQDNLARLKTRKILEERYQTLLRQAKNVREIMQIERELNNLRYEIEAAEAMKKGTEFEVQMSQIRLELRYEKHRSEVAPAPGSGFWDRVGYSFRRAFQNLQDIILWIIQVLPAGVLLLAVLALPVWWWRRRRRNRPTL